jgi:UDP:flavonoid glycosyltransferase YjiC (YdhE family)
MMNIAGMNSARSAFEHGVPMVLLPIRWEQMFNAARCEALGLARVLDAGALTPAAVRAAVWEVLTDQTYRARAARVRDDVAAMPGPEYAVALLERLAAERRPLLAAS